MPEEVICKSLFLKKNFKFVSFYFWWRESTENILCAVKQEKDYTEKNL